MEGFGSIEEIGYLKVACLNGQILSDLSHVRVRIVTPVSLRG